MPKFEVGDRVVKKTAPFHRFHTDGSVVPISGIVVEAIYGEFETYGVRWDFAAAAWGYKPEDLAYEDEFKQWIAEVRDGRTV